MYADEFGVFSPSLISTPSSQLLVSESLSTPPSFAGGALSTLSWNVGTPAGFHVKPAMSVVPASTTSLSGSTLTLPPAGMSELRWTATTPAAAPMTYIDAAKMRTTLPGISSDFGTSKLQLTQPALFDRGW